jgi:hypothetical protein
MKDVIDALVAEQTDLDEVLGDLPPRAWDMMTPAEPWTIDDTISHLAFFDERQTEAITDRQKFCDEINQRMTGGTDDYMKIGTD